MLEFNGSIGRQEDEPPSEEGVERTVLGEIWENDHDHKFVWLLKERLWGDGVVNMTAFEITMWGMLSPLSGLRTTTAKHETLISYITFYTYNKLLTTQDTLATEIFDGSEPTP
jgi:hypothetical protein